MSEKFNKYVLALDLVEDGSETEIKDIKKNQLPPSITSKMLYADIVKIAWPSVVELTLTQLASMVDLMMVGGLGAWALTSVGLTVQPKFLLMTIFMAMNVGATAMAARYKGAGDQEKANLILRQALLLTLIISVISSITGYVFAEKLILFMGAAEEKTLHGGTIYLKIQMVGFTFMALTSTITAALRGVGNSRTAMIYNLTSNVVNVFLNYLLIEGHFGFPRLEVAGASLATIIGQLFAFVFALTYIMKGDQYLHLRFMDGFKPDPHSLKQIVTIGAPAMLEQLLMRVGVIIYVKTIAGLGTVAYAVHQVCMNIQALSFMNGQGFAVSATSLTGQSLGKNRPDMAHAYVHRTRRLGMSVSLILAAIFVFWGGKIVSLYNDSPDIISQGARIMMFVGFTQPLQSSQFILSGSLRGAGDTRATAIITFITVLLIRPLLAVYLINVWNLGLEGAWFAFIADQTIRSALVLIRYNSGKWKRIKV
ncbi:MAG: MATE family efflux transporter [Bacillota bacterium]|jgi:putative MATE family efflux protein|nr:MATE family efflux transporter [Bacillota bacterium]NLL59450.1 MATE family efflux transporter [Tissierellia bacterium]